MGNCHKKRTVLRGVKEKDVELGHSACATAAGLTDSFAGSAGESAPLSPTTLARQISQPKRAVPTGAPPDRATSPSGFSNDYGSGQLVATQRLKIPAPLQLVHEGQEVELVPPTQASAGRAVRATVLCADGDGIAVGYLCRPDDATAWGLPFRRAPKRDGAPHEPGEVILKSAWNRCNPQQLAGKIPLEGKAVKRCRVQGVTLRNCTIEQSLLSKCTLESCPDVYDSVVVDTRVTGPCLLRDCFCVERCELEPGEEQSATCKLEGCNLKLCCPVTNAEFDQCKVEECVLMHCTLLRNVRLEKGCCVDRCKQLPERGPAQTIRSAGQELQGGCFVDASCKVTAPSEQAERDAAAAAEAAARSPASPASVSTGGVFPAAVGADVQVCSSAAELRAAVARVGEEHMGWDDSLADALGQAGVVTGFDDDIPGTAEVQLGGEGGDVVTIPVAALSQPPAAAAGLAAGEGPHAGELRQLLTRAELRLCADAARLRSLVDRFAAAFPDDLEAWPDGQSSEAAGALAEVEGFDSDIPTCADVALILGSARRQTWVPLPALEGPSGTQADPSHDEQRTEPDTQLRRLLLGAELRIRADVGALRSAVSRAVAASEDLVEWEGELYARAAGAIARVEGFDPDTPHCADICVIFPSGGEEQVWAPLGALEPATRIQ